MPFSSVVFIAALWALSSEMIEDSLVDLIYGHIYGWRILTYALIAASSALVTISAISIYYALALLVQYLDVVTKASAILLGIIGLFWLVSSASGKTDSEVEEAREAGLLRRSQLGKFFIAFQLVVVEELEILLIMIPLVVAAHALEAILAATVGVVLSLSTALALRKNFEKLVAGKLRYLKLASGSFLVILAIVLFLEI